MDKSVLIPSASLGLLLICIYLYRCWRNNQTLNLAVMINTIFQASGIICGFFLIISIFFPQIRNLMAGIDIYIFVGGIAVLAVSIQGFHRDAILSTSEKSNEISSENDNQNNCFVHTNNYYIEDKK